jgi:transposase
MVDASHGTRFFRGNTCREFTPEFTDEAVKLVINTGRAVTTVARELGVNETTLGRWVNLFTASQDAGEVGITETETVELRRLRLRTENADLKLDRALLKKPPSSSPRKPRIRTPSVRTDAGEEDQLQHPSHGPPPLRVLVGLLRLGLVGINPKRWRTTTASQAADACPIDAVKREWDTGN